jgi:hypothetical protein
MNRRELLTLALALGASARARAADDEKRDRFRESRYPSAIYSLRESQSKTHGVYRMKLDNRTLEITLPEPEPNEFFMPQAVTTKGTQASEAFVAEKLRRYAFPTENFRASWRYGMLDGALVGDSAGGIGAGMEVKPNALILVTDRSTTPPLGVGDNSPSRRRLVEVDYFKLEDFIRAVISESNPNPYRVERINGRQWVRERHWWRRDRVPKDVPPQYREYWYTPVDRRRILKLDSGFSYGVDYAIPDEMPGWMQRASRNITAVLRSIKLSPPDDGSPDPFLLDPEMKPEAEPVTFPAKWQ